MDKADEGATAQLFYYALLGGLMLKVVCPALLSPGPSGVEAPPAVAAVAADQRNTAGGGIAGGGRRHSPAWAEAVDDAAAAAVWGVRSLHALRALRALRACLRMMGLCTTRVRDGEVSNGVCVP